MNAKAYAKAHFLSTLEMEKILIIRFQEWSKDWLWDGKIELFSTNVVFFKVSLNWSTIYHGFWKGRGNTFDVVPPPPNFCEELGIFLLMPNTYSHIQIVSIACLTNLNE